MSSGEGGGEPSRDVNQDTDVSNQRRNYQTWTGCLKANFMTLPASTQNCIIVLWILFDFFMCFNCFRLFFSILQLSFFKRRFCFSFDPKFRAFYVCTASHKSLVLCLSRVVCYSESERKEVLCLSRDVLGSPSLFWYIFIFPLLSSCTFLSIFWSLPFRLFVTLTPCYKIAAR